MTIVSVHGFYIGTGTSCADAHFLGRFDASQSESGLFINRDDRLESGMKKFSENSKKTG